MRKNLLSLILPGLFLATAGPLAAREPVGATLPLDTTVTAAVASIIDARKDLNQKLKALADLRARLNQWYSQIQSQPQLISVEDDISLGLYVIYLNGSLSFTSDTFSVTQCYKYREAMMRETDPQLQRVESIEAKKYPEGAQMLKILKAFCP